MRILVPIKRVPAPETRIRLQSDGSRISTDGVTFVINPFDEIAVEEALRIREEGRIPGVGEIIAVTIGGEECSEQIRTALAMGADRAVHVLETAMLDPFAIARVLRAVVAREEPGLVLMGKQAIDDDSNQVGQMLAGLLGWPQATFVSRLTGASGGQIDCTRETDAGLEMIRVRLPAVVTTDLRLNEPRYVSLPGIMRARNKPVEHLLLTDLGMSAASRAHTRALESPAQRPAGVRVGSVAELLERLHADGLV